jgi:hypothetical protein
MALSSPGNQLIPDARLERYTEDCFHSGHHFFNELWCLLEMVRGRLHRVNVTCVNIVRGQREFLDRAGQWPEGSGHPRHNHRNLWDTSWSLVWLIRIGELGSSLMQIGILTTDCKGAWRSRKLSIYTRRWVLWMIIWISGCSLQTLYSCVTMFHFINHWTAFSDIGVVYTSSRDD